MKVINIKKVIKEMEAKKYGDGSMDFLSLNNMAINECIKY